MPFEKLEVQGYPVVNPEMTVGLEMPFASALPMLSQRQQSSLAGNAMHFGAIGSVLAYTLAFTEFVDPE